MRVTNMMEMKHGWFIGDFEPSVFRTRDFEVGIKTYSKGENHSPHYHKIATEINYLIRGLLKANNQIVQVGQLFIFEPDEIATCEFLTDCEILVVKTPSIIGDKYEI